MNYKATVFNKKAINSEDRQDVGQEYPPDYILHLQTLAFTYQASKEMCQSCE